MLLLGFLFLLENYNFRDGNLSLKKEKEEEEDREEEEEKEDEVKKEEVEGAQSLGTTPASGLRLHQWLWAWRMGVADLGHSESQNVFNQLQTKYLIYVLCATTLPVN